MSLTDLEIANSVALQPIGQIAAKLGIEEDRLEYYGKYKAKVILPKLQPKGKLILVTAMNPTKMGEGKTTITVGLGDGLKLIGKKVCLALREPSLGPVFGIKGGACGGGYAQVAPMEDINLHFTGDLHAITAANNLLSAVLDNSLHSGNPLRLDAKRITWRRCMDMNDRSLRNIVIGLGGKNGGATREEGFDITAASEIMAVLCLANGLSDLIERLGKITVGYDMDGNPVTCAALHVEQALAILLKDAIKPNLVQTLEGTPTFIHGGPFANIAHGCNSILATKTALTYADYVVTEAGFGADLGAEKFIDIKCRTAGLQPKAIVLVASIRALKQNGGAVAQLGIEDVAAVKVGLCNLGGHITNITRLWKQPVAVAINRFTTDTEAELAEVKQYCESLGVPAVITEAWAKGGEGARALAETVAKLADDNTDTQLHCTYGAEDGIKEKIEAVATKVYGAGEVEFTAVALKALKDIGKVEGASTLPVCIAKTQYSFSDNASLLGRPTGFKLTIQNLVLKSGAGFIVAIAGDIMLMPGLPRVSNAEKMTIDAECKITGLF